MSQGTWLTLALDLHGLNLVALDGVALGDPGVLVVPIGGRCDESEQDEQNAGNAEIHDGTLNLGKTGRAFQYRGNVTQREHIETPPDTSSQIKDNGSIISQY